MMLLVKTPLVYLFGYIKIVFNRSASDYYVGVHSSQEVALQFVVSVTLDLKTHPAMLKITHITYHKLS